MSRFINTFQHRQNACCGGIHIPAALWIQRQTRTVSATTFVTTTESRCGSPRHRYQLTDRKSGSCNGRLQVKNVFFAWVEERMRQWILPNQIFLRYFRSDVTRFRPHITVRQFKPRTGKGFVERLRIVKETTRDLLELRIKAQGQVGDQHCWLAFFRRIKRIGDNLRCVNRFKLNSACRAASLHPLIFEQVLEEIVAPLGRSLRPDNFQTRSDGICTRAAAVAAGPAQALRFNWCRFRIRTNMGCWCCTVGFAQRMTTTNQRDSFFVVHSHVTEGRANSRCRRKRFAAMVRPFRVHIDKAHFGCAQRRFCQLFRMAVSQPGFLITPVYVQIRFPDVFTPCTKTEGTET